MPLEKPCHTRFSLLALRIDEVLCAGTRSCENIYRINDTVPVIVRRSPESYPVYFSRYT